MVARQRLLKDLENVAAMIGFFHIDEIDDDDAAEIAQTQLPRDRDGRFEVGPVDRLLEIAMPDIPARVDVDRRHRFSLVEDQVATRLEGNIAIQ